MERLQLCAAELQRLLAEEKLAGATLLILANKQDLPGALPAARIKQAWHHVPHCLTHPCMPAGMPHLRKVG